MTQQETKIPWMIGAEMDLRNFLDKGAPAARALLLNVMIKRQNILPDLEVYIDANSGNTAMVKALPLNVGNYEPDVYISPEGMYWVAKVIKPNRVKDLDIAFLRRPAWYSKKEVDLNEYLSYASRARIAIDLAVDKAIQASKLSS